MLRLIAFATAAKGGQLNRVEKPAIPLAHTSMRSSMQFPFPSKMNYLFSSQEFATVLETASNAELGKCSKATQIHLNHAIHRAFNFFATSDLGALPSGERMTELDLLRMVLNCRGLPNGSIKMALMSALYSVETARHFKSLAKDDAARVELEKKEEMYLVMLHEIKELLRVRESIEDRELK